jgi:acrylyl-CoA reductase (NADPH)
MLAVIALEQHDVTPASGPVLVTGAAGGLGSVATAILAKLGYSVTCSTGRAETHDYLRGLGASEIIDRDSIAKPSGKPLDGEKWAGAIDAVGGSTLAAILPQIKLRGSIASCGLAGGSKLETTVIPFLLRGVNLLGIDSVVCPMKLRQTAWNRLTQDLPFDKLEHTIEMAKLDDLPRLGKDILNGGVRGRVIVEIGG